MTIVHRSTLALALAAALAAAPTDALARGTEAAPDAQAEPGQAEAASGGGAAPVASVDADALAAARAEVERARRELAEAAEALAALAGERAEERRLAAEERAMARAERGLTAEAHRHEVERERLRGAGRPIIGIVMSRADEGVRLSAVTPGGPADKAGLRSGEVLIAIDGTALTDRDPVGQARELLADMEAGDEYALRIRDKDGDEREVVVAAAEHVPTLRYEFRTDGPRVVVRGHGLDKEGLAQIEEELARAEETLAHRLPSVARAHALRVDPDGKFKVWNWGYAWSGLELAPLNPDLGRYFGVDEGALVLDVSDLEGDELVAGDVIRAVSGRPVTTPSEVMRELRRYQAGELVDVDLVRDGAPLVVTVTTPEGASGGPFFFDWQQAERRP